MLPEIGFKPNLDTLPELVSRHGIHHALGSTEVSQEPINPGDQYLLFIH